MKGPVQQAWQHGKYWANLFRARGVNFASPNSTLVTTSRAQHARSRYLLLLDWRGMDVYSKKKGFLEKEKIW